MVLFFYHYMKADKAYKQLIMNKPVLESWLMKISECSALQDDSSGSAGGAGGAMGSQVNHFIQQLAQRYTA